MAGARSVGLRLLLAHALAYPVAVAWALGAIPVLVVGIASATGTSLDDEAIAHRVLVRVAWPALGSFALMHGAGVVWAFSRDDALGRRTFWGALAVLGGVALVGGGASWLWLMTR
jgi:hypothetical protein